MRTPTSFNQVVFLAGCELQNHLEHEERFTAYDITRALRARNPGLNIPHAPVRLMVHRCMDIVVRTGYYQSYPVDYGGRPAIMYAPTPVLSLCTLAQVSLN